MRSQDLTSASSRMGALRAILLLLFALLAARAGQLSVVSPQALQHGDRQIHAWITVPSARGLILDRDHKELAISIRESLTTWKDGKDLVEIGAYKPGTNPKLDLALLRLPAIEAFARQGLFEVTDFKETRELLGMLLSGEEGVRT